MSTNNRSMTTSTLFLSWILVNALGGFVVGGLEAWRFQFLATLVLSGPILGAVQWFVLWQGLGMNLLWVLVSSVGWFLGIAVSIYASPLTDPLIQALYAALGQWEVLWLNAVNQTIVLSLFGLAQWVLLRRRVETAALWIPISALAGLAYGVAGASFCAAACDPLGRSLGSIAATGMSSAVAWAAYSIVTGYALVRIFSERIQS